MPDIPEKSPEKPPIPLEEISNQIIRDQGVADQVLDLAWGKFAQGSVPLIQQLIASQGRALPENPTLEDVFNAVDDVDNKMELAWRKRTAGLSLLLCEATDEVKALYPEDLRGRIEAIRDCIYLFTQRVCIEDSLEFDPFNRRFEGERSLLSALLEIGFGEGWKPHNLPSNDTISGWQSKLLNMEYDVISFFQKRAKALVEARRESYDFWSRATYEGKRLQTPQNAERMQREIEEAEGIPGMLMGHQDFSTFLPWLETRYPAGNKFHALLEELTLI